MRSGRRGRVARADDLGLHGPPRRYVSTGEFSIAGCLQRHLAKLVGTVTSCEFRGGTAIGATAIEATAIIDRAVAVGGRAAHTARTESHRDPDARATEQGSPVRSHQ